MGVLDKFLDAIKLNDDYDDDEFLDEDLDGADDDDFLDDEEEARSKKKFFEKFTKKKSSDDEFDDMMKKKRYIHFMRTSENGIYLAEEYIDKFHR